MSDYKPFTYDYYKALMLRASEIAPITTLEGKKDGRGIILRHDVDFDILPAYEMALVEEEIGIRSTYFIMTTCQFYNPAFPRNKKCLAEMTKKGFEIGLHFDPTLYGNSSQEEMEFYLNKESSVLESIIGRKVASISLHNPSITGKFPIFEGYNNAYSDEVFSDMAYLSDSCMDFRDKDPFIFIEEAKKRQVQMLFHPLHWSENGNNYIEIFSEYIHTIIESIDDNFRVNFTYVASLGKQSLLDIILSGDENKNIKGV